MLRRTSFIITIIGLIILSSFFLLSPIKIKDNQEIFSLTNNQKITLSGKVIKESRYTNWNVLYLNNNITLQCEKCPSFLNKEVEITAIISTYNNKKQVIVLKIKEIS